MSAFDIKPAFRLAIVSDSATRRKTEIEKETSFRQEWYPWSYRPANRLVVHLQFHLRNEVFTILLTLALISRCTSAINAL